MAEELLTTEEAACELRISQKTVLRLVRSGKMRAHKVGRAWRIRRSDLLGDYVRSTSDVVYLDDNASNPIDPRVRQVMFDVLGGSIGNASSAHSVGYYSRELVENAREQIAELVQARANEVVFTSGATEANNLILRGFPYGQRTRLLVSAGEHDSVARVAEALATTGRVSVDVVPLRSSGEVDLGALAAMIRDDVALVSVVAANSETGVLNPIRDISDLAHEAGARVHCDATQWLGRLPFSFEELGVDAISLSGHKMSGPQGVGALVARRPILRQLIPQALGGAHEDGLRSGTYNVAGIAGIGAAACIAADPSMAARLARLRDQLVASLTRIDGAALNGSGSRLPNTANVRFRGVPGDALLARTPAVAASLGSACHSGAIEPSPTLLAMGLSREAASESVRLSVTRFTTPSEIDRAAAELIRSVTEIRDLHQEVA